MLERVLSAWVAIYLGVGCLVGSLGTLLLPGRLGGVIAGTLWLGYGVWMRRRLLRRP